MLYQACYSAAPVYLSSVIAHQPEAAEIARAIIIFIILYALPYPLSFAATVLRVVWRSAVRRFLYEEAYRRTASRAAAVTSNEAEKSFAALITANGQEIVTHSIDFVHGTMSLLCSTLFSVVLISAFVLRDFALAYVVSAALCGLLIWKLGPWQARKAAQTERAYNALMAGLPQAWLANSLGEERAVARFMRIFARRWRHHRRVSLSAMSAFEVFNLLQAVCIWGPAAAVVLFRMSSMTVVELVALAIVLPRLTEALLDMSGLFQNITDYVVLKGRVSWLNDALMDETVDLGSRLELSRLRLLRKEPEGGWRKLPIASVDDVRKHTSAPGRYVIGGENGSGKSTLLLLLKIAARQKSIYIPANGRLFPAARRDLSTGQQKLRDLRALFADMPDETGLILLDEWDANLDSENRAEVSTMLDTLARDRTVIEVTHRSVPAVA
jgi:ABC-type bacteriocin/lantibiotic exporter with double-glycine peptidase domain